MKQALRLVARATWSGPRLIATRARHMLGRPTGRPPAWDADVLDDFAFNRPWNLVVKVLRMRALLLQSRLREGETIVIVNWNTLQVLRDTLHAVSALTPASVAIMVVDNGSTDGSREWLRGQPDLRVVALPINAGHAVALDIATLLCRTDVAVTLDSDAVPLRNDWLDAVLEPIRRPGMVLVGSRSSRNFVHPIFSAVDVRAFARRKLSFQVWRLPEVADEDLVWGESRWDTAELMTARVDPTEVAFVERTTNPVDGLPGMTAGGAVYHHGGVTRQTEAADNDLSSTSYGNWRSALEQLLPPGALRG